MALTANIWGNPARVQLIQKEKQAAKLRSKQPDPVKDRSQEGIRHRLAQAQLSGYKLV